MDFKKVKKNKKDLVYLDVKEVDASVRNVRVLSDNAASFTLRCKGFSLYDMKMIEKKEGGYFITAPDYKGKDGKYYPVYAVYLSEYDQGWIIDKVCEAIEIEAEGNNG